MLTGFLPPFPELLFRLMAKRITISDGSIAQVENGSATKDKVSPTVYLHHVCMFPRPRVAGRRIQADKRGNSSDKIIDADAINVCYQDPLGLIAYG